MQLAVLIVVIACWCVLLPVMVFGKGSAARNERKKDRSAWIGLVLQGAAFGLVWGLRRDDFVPPIAGSWMVEMLLALIAIILSICSLSVVVWSVRVLGKQWALVARVLDDHKLITEGPYGLVRHPIYTGMFGMMLATAIAISLPIAAFVAVPIFWWGTIIRIRSEEKLLHEQFGGEFESYVDRVSAILPRFPH